jgi:hypothetical protein
MRQRRLMGALVVLSLLAGCQWGPTEAQRRQAAERQRALAQCQRHQAALPQLLARFETDRQGVLALKADIYAASPPPRPLDPEEQSRLTIYDQQSEQEQYDQALALWQEREQRRRAAWEARQTRRLQEAEGAFRRTAAVIRQVSPDLLDKAPLPTLQRDAVARYRSCRPEAFR